MLRPCPTPLPPPTPSSRPPHPTPPPHSSNAFIDVDRRGAGAEGGHGRPFVSAKRVVRDLGPDYDGFELVSFHSTSKGLIGECGRRGGYMELCGFDAKVQAQMYKLASAGACSGLPLASCWEEQALSRVGKGLRRAGWEETAPQRCFRGYGGWG